MRYCVFSACDGEGIWVSEHTRDLCRYQINQKDNTLWYADGPTDGTDFGGEKTPLIYDRVLVLSDYQILHLTGKSANSHDFHADSKSMKHAWKALEYLRKNAFSYEDDWMKISSDDLMIPLVP
jgi:hypothetical protein